MLRLVVAAGKQLRYRATSIQNDLNESMKIMISFMSRECDSLSYLQDEAVQSWSLRFDSIRGDGSAVARGLLFLDPLRTES